MDGAPAGLLFSVSPVPKGEGPFGKLRAGSGAPEEFEFSPMRL